MYNFNISKLEEVPGALNHLSIQLAELALSLQKAPTAEPTTTKTDQLLTRNDVAKQLRVSLPTLHDWTKNGKIKAYRIGNRVLYKPSDVSSALNSIKTYVNLNSTSTNPKNKLS
jgi:excisionase family DNA binding protein